MMHDTSQLSPDQHGSPASTAHQMADAVGYLMRVAAEAGLPAIVVKLANIRANLLSLANAQSPENGADTPEGETDEGNPQGSTHERRKPH